MTPLNISQGIFLSNTFDVCKPISKKFVSFHSDQLHTHQEPVFYYTTTPL